MGFLRRFSTASGGSFKEPYVMEEPFTSLLTINAMDGTVINRGWAIERNRFYSASSIKILESKSQTGLS